MSEQDKQPEEDIGTVPNSPIVIHKQYLKDFSFENPNAPEILKRGNTPPETDMSIGLDVNKIEHEEYEHFYEVVVNIKASAVREGQTMFVADIAYGATVSITGLDIKKHHPLLLIEVPQMIFPFVRQILAHASLSGGFLPLQLQPIDFRSMYLKRFAGEEKSEENSAEKTAE
jgi:preprotein translocase subunit SecB